MLFIRRKEKTAKLSQLVEHNKVILLSNGVI